MTLQTIELRSKPDGYYSNCRQEMFSYIPQNVKRTLEFGCADGRFSDSIKVQYGAECWGVEIDEEAARTASKKLDKVIHSDANKSVEQIPDDYFDCIIFNDILEHLIDPFSLLKSIRTKLTTGGVVVASIPNVRYWSNLKGLVLHGNWNYSNTGILDKTHLRFFTYKSLLSLFTSLEYEILKIEGIRPTRSRSLKICNFLFLNKLWDSKYHQFACVVKPLR
jgi:2-polyprenyl-3-methyl-5-hydroxy-6-metoxy-1,4-benzoquinol methylase